MSAIFEGRPSDSPYIDMIWRVQIGQHYTPTCPADSHWDLLFMRKYGQMRVTVEGPLTRSLYKTHPEGTECLVIRFKLGTFLPFLSLPRLLDADALLPNASGRSFWLHGSTWHLPDFENVETFVHRLIRQDLLSFDPLISTVLQHQRPDLSERTIRRRFLRATGLTPKTIKLIERAQQATTLLEQGISISDAAYQMGYADQSHMTRALKHFTGQTPAQIIRSHASV